MSHADGRGLTRLPPWVLATALAAAYLLLDPGSADLAAQEYRSALFARAGFALWDNGWYARHHVSAYSLLFPPLGAWLGPQTVAFDRLRRFRAWAGRPRGQPLLADAFLGTCTALAAACAARWMGRAHPAAWSWPHGGPGTPVTAS